MYQSSEEKKFQLDSSRHRFIISHDFLHTADESRLGIDVHEVIEVPEGHRENSIEVPGIQKKSEFRTTKSLNGKSNFFTREVICFCEYCVLSKYDQCLSFSAWEKHDVDVDPQKNVAMHRQIAKFYHSDL